MPKKRNYLDCEDDLDGDDYQILWMMMILTMPQGI
jgi:hypothetical protein